MRESLLLLLGSLAPLVVGAFVATSCFDPNFENPLTCSEEAGCPGALVCLDNRCQSRGGPDSGDNEFSFTDTAFSGFEQGQLVGTATTADGLQLEEGAANGSLTSRVFDGERETLNWSRLGFVPKAPFGLPLPDSGMSETRYSSGNANMDDNVFLLHCDESIENTAPSQLSVVETIDGARYLDGRLNQSCQVDGNSTLTVSASSGLSFGTSDYTWAMWVQTTTSCEGNDVIFGGNTQNEDPTGSHAWFGCARSDDAFNAPMCPPGPGGYFGGVHAANSTQQNIGFCSQTVINDGIWHHVAVVKTGHESTTLRAYVDGRLEATVEGSFLAPFSFPADAMFGIGYYPPGGYDTTDTTAVDELAVWRRALTPLEVTGLATRGAVSARLQVASCSDSTCAGPFTNENGEADRFIVDQGGGEPPTVPLDLIDERYLRYRIDFETIIPELSPVIESVSVFGVR